MQDLTPAPTSGRWWDSRATARWSAIRRWAGT